jgi:ABC-type bacteriocin/lantibiotic exporter with double-glycine peptidase domain
MPAKLPAYKLQTTSFNCGPAALHNALLSIGVNRSIRTLARLCGTSRRFGTPEHGIYRAANVRRVVCDTPTFARETIRVHTPVLLCVDVGADGPFQHWVAVVHTTKQYVTIADSARPGPVVQRITWRRLFQRFHVYGERYYIYVVSA